MTTTNTFRTVPQLSQKPALIKTEAASIYQKLVDEGYAMRDIIALSSQLLGFASQELTVDASITLGSNRQLSRKAV